MFECPHCGAMPSTALAERLGADAELATKLGQGETREELIADLVAHGTPTDEATERVRRVAALSALGGDEIRRHRQREPFIYTRNMIRGVPMAIAGLVCLFWPLFGLVSLMVGLALFILGAGDICYGISRHWRVLTRKERRP